MKQVPSGRSTSASPVRIRSSKGRVNVEAACLFASRYDTAVHRLIERLFRLDAVRTVEVDRHRATVEIEYDGTAMAPAVALSHFSKALSAGDTMRTETALGWGLEQIPGRVRRVERGGRPLENRAAAAKGSGAAAWSDQGGAARKTRAAVGQENLTIGAEEWIVAYDPAPAKLIAPAALPPTRNGAGPWNGPLAVPTTRAMGRNWLSQGESLGEALRRTANLTAAGGCFALSIVGVWTPGIPTVPFVLATSYFLARSSPVLHERFKRSRLFGPMVRDWEEHGGLRPSTKLKLVAITLTLVGATIVIAGFALPLVIVMGLMCGVSLMIVLRLPTVPEILPARRIIAAT
ncbi:MAG TPA: YbaN family protein [Pirellulales bacterium]|nr:YbaN family protein [Pirellulales bacterium]